MDLKIYLDVYPELMLKRREIRFGPAHVSEYDAKVAIPEFLKYGITQKKYADYVIDATKPQTRVIKKVQKIIESFKRSPIVFMSFDESRRRGGTCVR